MEGAGGFEGRGGASSSEPDPEVTFPDATHRLRAPGRPTLHLTEAPDSGPAVAPSSPPLPSGPIPVGQPQGWSDGQGRPDLLSTRVH